MAVIISGNMYLVSEVTDFPANHARIGLQNVLKNAVINASYSDPFFPENAFDDTTYTMWKPSLPTDVIYEAQLDAGYEIDYFGLAAHNLGTFNGNVKLDYWDGADWQELVPQTNIDDNEPVMVLFSKKFVSRIKFTFNADFNFSLGVVYVGKAFSFERPFFKGHRPLKLNRTTSIEQKITEKGLDVGRYIIKKGATTNIAVNNQSPAFIRNKFLPLMLDARTRGFFFAWRPDTYPNDIAFCWTRENIAPKNNGKKEMMNVAFTVKAI